MTSARVEVEGRELSLSNLEKVLYPETGFTKGEVIQYYREIAPAIRANGHIVLAPGLIENARHLWQLEPKLVVGAFV